MSTCDVSEASDIQFARLEVTHKKLFRELEPKCMKSTFIILRFEPLPN